LFDGYVFHRTFCIIWPSCLGHGFTELFALGLAKRKGMHPGRRIFTLKLLAAGVSLIPAVSADAHAVLLESNPALKSTVSGPDVPVKLRFNVRIDASRSRLTLVAPDGSMQTLEISQTASPDTLSAEAKGLAPGDYRLRWQVLASDGHITRGEIPFTVTHF
jgi:copper resistance protein C